MSLPPPRTSRRRGAGWLLVAALAALSLALSACGSGGAGSGSGADATPRPGGTARVGMVELSWTSLDPASSTYAARYSPMMMAIYGSMFSIADDGTISPGIAQSYAYSADSLTLSITLREGVKFTDGTPLDADAVKFNWDRLIKSGSAAGTLPDVASVSTNGPTTVVLALKRPNHSVVPALSGPAAGSFIGSPTAIQKLGDDFGTQPVGAGPFRFVSQVPGSELKLTRNDGYYGDRPYLDGLDFTVVSTAQQALNGITAGGIDFYYQAAPEQVAQAASTRGAQVYEALDTGFYYISTNFVSGPFTDVRARQALARAIDQQALARAVYFGQADPTDSPFPPGSWAHPDAVAGYPTYDPAAAKALVDQLGGLKFTLNYRPTEAGLAEAMLGMLRAAGMDVTLEQLNVPTLFERYTTQRYDALIYSFGGPIDPHTVSRTGLLSTSIFGGKYANPEMDKLVAESVAVEDRAQRKAVYQRISDLFAKDLPLIPLTSVPLAGIAKDTLKGVDNLMAGPNFSKAWIAG